jgi:hypothetical protein
MPIDFSRFSGEFTEYQLRHVLREMAVAVELPKSRRIDKVQVSAHNFGEGILAFLVDVADKQISVVHEGSA